MSGRLGKASVNANANTTIYTVPSGKISTVNISLVNRNNEDTKIRVALSVAANPAVADYIEYDAVLPANGGILERTAVVMSAGERVIVWSERANVSVRVHGFVEDL